MAVKAGAGEKKDMFILVEPFGYKWLHEGVCHRYCVPRGFRTDGASVPMWMWSFSGIPPMGLHTAAAIPHDDLFSQNPVGIHQVEIHGEWVTDTRKWTYGATNRLFLRMLKESGVDKARRTKMYWAVQLFGWLFYQKN